MEILAHHKPHNKYGQYGRSQSAYDIADSQAIVWDRATQGVNKKLMRLAVDSKRQSRQSLMYDESLPRSRSSTIFLNDNCADGSLQNLKITQFHDCDNARFPRMEVMSHFHYNSVDLDEPVELSLCISENEDISEAGLLVKVTAKGKSWILKRSIEDFIGLDRQIHRCIYDRRYSLLEQLGDFELEENLTADMVHKLQGYISRFSKLVGNNVNCGPILNWLELDNHGNHLVVMEADDSAINVPAIAAGRVIKRYQAQAADEITLDVGEFLSIIDMPPVEETIWWRGKKGFEVGFFPSHCIEILGVKDVTDKVIGDLASRPVAKRRGKFISFLRFFFKSRPSKDELMQNGILRERVFGCDLGERLALVGREVPLVLEMCSEVIEEYGVVDGIYRLSGILSNLQRLRIAFDSGDEPPNLEDPRYLNDIHCISSLLKTYFRELPNPLFTHELYDKFVAAIEKNDDTEKTVAFHHVIQRLPPPHYRTMHALLRHLNYCAVQHKVTNMTAKNLAIVWAPNLLRPNVDSVSALTEFRTQAIIVEYMIRNVDVFFNSNLASAAIAYYPESVESTSEEISRPNSATPNMGGTKLISLEEARLRVLHNRMGSESSADDAANNSPRHKIRSMIEPPQLSAAPISPLPTLLSLEEAQARTRSNIIALNGRGSIDLPDSDPNDESPKRNKKWFGLFSKSKNQSDEDVGKAAFYRKKEGRHLLISSPTQLYSNLNGNSEGGVSPKPELRNLTDKTDECDIVPLTQVEDDLDIPMHTDNDDIMSAIVSVSNKYTSMPSRRLESQKACHRRSITIGEPSELRRSINANDLTDFKKFSEIPGTEKGEDVGTGKASSDSKRRSTDWDDKEDFRATVVPYYERLKDSDSYSSNDNQDPEGERRFRSHREGTNDHTSNVPAKKIRSFSPENYCNPNPSLTMESADHGSKKYSNPNAKRGSIPHSEASHTSVNERSTNENANKLPLSEDVQVSTSYSTSGTASNTSTFTTVERRDVSSRGSKDESHSTNKNHDKLKDRNSSETVFQLIAVPKCESLSREDYDANRLNETEDSEQETLEQSNPDDSATSVDSVINMNNTEPPGIGDEDSKNKAYSKPSIERSKSLDQKFRYRQFGRKCEDKNENEEVSKTNDISERGSRKGNNEHRHHSRYSKNKSFDQKNIQVRTSTRHSGVSIDDEDSVYKKGDEIENSRHDSCHDRRTNHDTHNVERSYSLSVKDKVNLFNNPERCKSSAPLNVDLRSMSESKQKSSGERPTSDQIRSTPNLYLHTEHSARPLPTSLNNKYKNMSSKEKDCENCETNRRSTYSHPPADSEDSNENKIPSTRQQRTNTYKNSRNSKDDKTLEQTPSKTSCKPDRSCVVEDKLVSSSQRNKEQSKPPIKPRHSVEQKFRLDNSLSRTPVSSNERTCHDVDGIKSNRTSAPLLSSVQSPFFSILQKSVSDNYLHGDGKLIGRFPLTLKNGATISGKGGFDRNLKKRDSRPLSMYDNVRHSYYDNITAVRYDLV